MTAAPQSAPRVPAGYPGTPPYPATPATRLAGEEAGQLPRRSRRASPARDFTTPPEVPGPKVRQGRGRRSLTHAEKVNQLAAPGGNASQAAVPSEVVRASGEALISVITMLQDQDPDAAAAWAWTVAHLADGACTLMEAGAEPHPGFRNQSAQRLNPSGWAPPLALIEVAAFLAGADPKENGSD